MLYFALNYKWGMKVKFQSEDEKEIKRLIKSTDMAHCLWEIVHNGWRDFKHSDYDYEKSWDKINQIIAEHNIDVDDLIDWVFYNTQIKPPL